MALEHDRHATDNGVTHAGFVQCGEHVAVYGQVIKPRRGCDGCRRDLGPWPDPPLPAHGDLVTTVRAEPAAGTLLAAAAAAGPTIGVEEEFALLDPRTGHVAMAGPDLVASYAGDWGVASEFMTYMVEIRTPVCRSLAEAHSWLGAKRLELSGRAEQIGAALVATGAVPFGLPGVPPISDTPRYRRLATRFPFAARVTGTCGCHVHVAVPTPTAGVAALYRLRPWLPALIALTANSPVWRGRDSGWASLRYALWSRWPTAVPAPPVRTVAEYDAAVRTAVVSGQALDARSVYFSARLSPRHPTLEVRVADVAMTVDEATAYAGLVRALVAQALDDAAEDRPALDIPQPVLVDACRRAARGGLPGRVLDVTSGRRVRGWDLVDDLVAHALPRLERHGEAAGVLGTLHRMRVMGGGADRQRRLLAAAPDPAAFVAALAAATTAPLGRPVVVPVTAAASAAGARSPMFGPRSRRSRASSEPAVPPASASRS